VVFFLFAGFALGWFTLLPVTVERSVSVFMLSYMDQNSETGITAGEFGEIFYQKYIEEYCNLTKKDLALLERVSNVDGKERTVKLFTRRQIRAIMQANRMRCKKFDETMLITIGKVSGYRFLPRDPRKNEIFYKVKKIAMSLVTMTLTASITVDAVLDLSWATVAECAVKLVAMAWAWTSGHMFGWDNTTKDEVYFLRSKAEWCDRADRWLNNYLPKAEEKGDN